MTVVVARTQQGERFIVKSLENLKVRCFGDVLRVSGASVSHGPDKVFLKERVEIHAEERTEDFLTSLWQQNKPAWERHLREKDLGELRRRWFNVSRDGRVEFTDWAFKQLSAEGYDIAADYLHGLSPDERDEADSMLQDMASDAAAYHYELTRLGIPEGHANSIREIAADQIYEGMLKANEKRRTG